MPLPPRLALAPTLAALLIAGCAGRPLSEAERGFAATVQGAALATAPVRVRRMPGLGAVRMSRPPRPRRACQDRIFPPETGPRVATSVAGFVLGSDLFVAPALWSRDYLAGYPGTLPLAPALFVAHELTHVWQWQHREITGYSPLRAAGEHAAADDPYLFDLDPPRPFLAYGFEQQAALVEEYVCCRALDPAAPRTARLHALLAPHFPDLARESPARRVALPWAGAETAGICRQG